MKIQQINSSGVHLPRGRLLWPTHMPPSIRAYLRDFRETPLSVYFLVFAGYFIVAKIGLYIFYSFHTSPALIWPPAGIGLAVILLYGNRMWLPVFLAQFLAYVSEGGWVYADISAVIALGYTLQSLVGAYLLQKFRFSLTLDDTRSA